MRPVLLIAVLLFAPVLASAQEAQPLPEGVAPLAGERPMRFFLTGGNSFVATRIGEDPEFFWVRQTDGALARVRKSDIARLSYRLEEVAPATSTTRAAPERPPSLAPLAEDEEGRGGTTPGKGLLVGGAVLAGVFYGGTLLFAPGAKGPGELLLIPIAGPLVYGLAREANTDDLVGLTVVSVLQGAGVLMIYLGIRRMNAASEERRHWTGWLDPPSLALVPTLSDGTWGLTATGTF